MGRRSAWTPEDEQILMHHMNLKLKTSAIAEQTGWPVWKISRARKKLEAGRVSLCIPPSKPKRRKSPETSENEQLLKHHMDMKLKDTTMTKQTGLPKRRKSAWTPEDEQALKHHMALKLKDSAIAEQTGLPVWKIYRGRKKIEAGRVSLCIPPSRPKRPRHKATYEKIAQAKILVHENKEKVNGKDISLACNVSRQTAQTILFCARLLLDMQKSQRLGFDLNKLQAPILFFAQLQSDIQKSKQLGFDLNQLQALIE